MPKRAWPSYAILPLAAGLLSAAHAGPAGHRGTALSRLRVGDETGAEKILAETLRSGPDDATTLLMLAGVSRPRPREALGFAERAARAATDPARRAAAHRLAAEIRLDLEDEAGARAALESALSADPDDLDALRLAARLARARPDEARAYAERAALAAARTPPWLRPAALRQSARAWSALEDDSKAAESLASSLEIEPDDVDALEALVEIAARRPERSKPLAVPAESPRLFEDHAWSDWTPEALKSAEERSPGSVEALRLRAASALARGKTKDAAAAAERVEEAIELAPPWQRGAACRLSARLWLALGRPEKALGILGKSFNPEYDSLSTARLQALAGERQGAKPAGRLLARFHDRLQESAELWEKLGDRARAQARRRLVFELQNREPETVRKLAGAEQGVPVGIGGK